MMLLTTSISASAIDIVGPNFAADWDATCFDCAGAPTLDTGYGIRDTIMSVSTFLYITQALVKCRKTATSKSQSVILGLRPRDSNTAVQYMYPHSTIRQVLILKTLRLMTIIGKPINSNSNGILKV
jgi:hypothetical protein